MFYFVLAELFAQVVITMRFAEHRGAMTTKDDSMHLDTISTRQEETRIRALQCTREEHA